MDTTILFKGKLDNEKISIFMPSVREHLVFYSNNAGYAYECDKYPLAKIVDRRTLVTNAIYTKNNIYTLVIYKGEICMLEIGKRMYDKLVEFIQDGNKTALIDLHIRINKEGNFPSYDDSYCSSPDMDSFDKERIQTDYNDRQNFIDDLIKSSKRWHQNETLVKCLEENCDVSLHKYQMEIRGEKIGEILDKV